MSINNIGNINSADNLSVKKLETSVAVSNQNKTSASDQSSEGRYDKFEKSPENTPSESGIYSKESIVEQLKLAEEQRQEAFNKFIQGMVTDQLEASNFSFMGLDLFVTEEDSAKALEAISDGGEYSVDAVATRIMDMAEALSGGDESKLALLRQAVKDGFADAMGQLGLEEDEMPEITSKTYDEVMTRFDKWEESFKTPEEETVAEETATEETTTEE